jgi:aryl-alcohol dehydrogenase-like predicted oxidoreductase
MMPASVLEALQPDDGDPRLVGWARDELLEDPGDSPLFPDLLRLWRGPGLKTRALIVRPLLSPTTVAKRDALAPTYAGGERNGAALHALMDCRASPIVATPTEETAMEYRSLGRTGVQVSALCLGGMLFGAPTDEAEALTIMDRALDTGLNFVDTANIYTHGRSEEIIGRALRRNGRRARVVLATKVHGRMDDQDPNAWGNSRRHILEQCEASLRRLQTEYIDLYQLHRPLSTISIDETLRALDDLVRSGKVRYLGTSTFAAWQLMEALWVSKELGLHRVVCEQPPYHLLDRRIERELVPMAQIYGLALLPWSPLAGGFLSRKYRRGEPPPRGSRLGQHPEGTDPHFTDAAFQVLEVLTALAHEKRATPRPGGTGLGGAAAGDHQRDHRAAHTDAVRGLPGRHGRPAHGRGPGAARRGSPAGASSRLLL